MMTGFTAPTAGTVLVKGFDTSTDLHRVYAHMVRYAGRRQWRLCDAGKGSGEGLWRARLFASPPFAAAALPHQISALRCAAAAAAP